MDEQKTPPSASEFIQSLRERAAATTAVLEKEPEKAVEPVAAAVVETPKAETPAETPAVSPTKLMTAIKALKAIERNVHTVITLLEAEPQLAGAVLASLDPADAAVTRELELAGVRAADGRVVEGVFDGTQMVGADGKTYPVPPNYASKSKLVEGDMLKVTITPRGNFIFKQIGPIDRANVIATLGFDPTNGEFYATSEDKRWSLLKASITFFKGEPGDDVALLIPKNGQSKWAAVENVIKKAGLIE